MVPETFVVDDGEVRVKPATVAGAAVIKTDEPWNVNDVLRYVCEVVVGIAFAPDVSVDKTESCNELEEFPAFVTGVS